MKYKCVLICLFISLYIKAEVYKEKDLVCPVCGENIKAMIVIKDRRKIGVDKDLCVHYGGFKNYYTYDVVICYNCGYASFLQDFCRHITPTQKKLIKKSLQEKTRKSLKLIIERYKKVGLPVDQGIIPSILKYNNAIKCYEITDAPPIVMAKIYLRAAYNARTELLTPLAGIQFNRALYIMQELLSKYIKLDEKVEDRKMIKVLKKILPQSKNRKVKFCIYMSMAGYYDKLGYYSKALQSIKKARALVDKKSKLYPIATARLHYVIAEQRYLQNALVNIKLSLKEGLNRIEDTGVMLYLVGELYRRTGNPEKGIQWFEAVSKIPTIKQTILKWSNEQLHNLQYLIPYRDPEDSEIISVSLNRLSVDYKDVRKKDIECQQRIKKIIAAILLFRMQTGIYPDDLESLVKLKYLKNYKILSCPFTGERYQYIKPKNDNKDNIVIYETKPHIIGNQRYTYIGKLGGEVVKIPK